jgi:hypothetical protein
MLLALFPLPRYSFSLQAVIESEVLKELLKLDPKLTSGSDGLDPLRLQPLSLLSPSLTFLTCLYSLGRLPLLGRQPQCILYLKGEVKLILTVIGPFLFFPC